MFTAFFRFRKVPNSRLVTPKIMSPSGVHFVFLSLIIASLTYINISKDLILIAKINGSQIQQRKLTKSTPVTGITFFFKSTAFPSYILLLLNHLNLN